MSAFGRMICARLTKILQDIPTPGQSNFLIRTLLLQLSLENTTVSSRRSHLLPGNVYFRTLADTKIDYDAFHTLSHHIYSFGVIYRISWEEQRGVYLLEQLSPQAFLHNKTSLCPFNLFLQLGIHARSFDNLPLLFLLPLSFVYHSLRTESLIKPQRQQGRTSQNGYYGHRLSCSGMHHHLYWTCSSIADRMEQESEWSNKSRLWDGSIAGIWRRSNFWTSRGDVVGSGVWIQRLEIWGGERRNVHRP